MSNTRSPLTAVLVAGSLVTTGCAGLLGPSPSAQVGTGVAVDLTRPEMRDFHVASAMTEVERDGRIDAGGQPERKPVTPALFWTGIGIGSVASAAAIGFGVAGFVTKNQLADGYSEDGLTEGERDDLVARGEAMNALTITAVSVAVLGFGLSVISAGVDWNRCGPLATKKRRCRERATSE